MLYTIKLGDKSQISAKVSEHVEMQHINIPFVVKELGYSDNIILLLDDYSKTKAKALIKDKIKEYLVKVAEQEEYTLEI